MRALIVALIGLCAVSEVVAVAQEPSPTVSTEISVIHSLALDPKVRVLPPGAQADVVVYLQSLGDPVDAVPVVLRDEKTWTKIQTKVTDRHGVVAFRRIPPGRYEIKLESNGPAMDLSLRSQSLSIAEILLYVSKKNQ